ncbi:MAG: type II toxin-antitoxin system RelB/DinJ family antitoxin [Synergistaceae bacterium]|nr:type II toxin-antitoxin system RelB/DinJ family antitoxin [Synergistaceae bacterium]
MSKETIVQISMDADLKEQVEELYRSMGTSFAEAVRIFAKQSIEENAMPFTIRAPKRNHVTLGYHISADYPDEEMTTLTAQVDEHDKAIFTTICDSIGITTSDAVNMFVKAVIREHKIPFEIKGD